MAKLRTNTPSLSKRKTETAPEPIPPRKTFSFPPEGWKDEWEGRPLVPVKVGLRFIGGDDVLTIHGIAMDRACKLHPNLTATDEVLRRGAHNEVVMQKVAAYATCRPNDSNREWIDAADSNITSALNPQGIQRVYEEYEDFITEFSPLHKTASDADLAELATMLLPLDAIVKSAIRIHDIVIAEAVRAGVDVGEDELAVRTAEGVRELLSGDLDLGNLGANLLNRQTSRIVRRHAFLLLEILRPAETLRALRAEAARVAAQPPAPTELVEPAP